MANTYINRCEQCTKKEVCSIREELLDLFDYIEFNFCDLVSTADDISIRLFCKHFEQKPTVEMIDDDDKEKKKTNKRRVNNE